MTENKNDSKKNADITKEAPVTKEKKVETKKKSPLFVRLTAFSFSLIVAGLLLYSLSMGDNIQARSCAEKQKQRLEFLQLKDRVDVLEKQLMVRGYVEGNTEVPALRQTLDSVFERIGNLEEQLHMSAQGAISDIQTSVSEGDTIEKVERIAQELVNLKGSVENLFTEKEIIKEQAAQLDESVKHLTARQDKEMQRFFALEKLQTAIRSQNPYGAELDTFTQLVANIPQSALDTLAQNKNTGIPSIESITQQLRKHIKQAITTAGSDSDWWDKTKANMSKVVTVRKHGYVEGADVEAILARAEHHLIVNPNIDGLKTALEEIGQLPSDKHALFLDWVKDAESIVNTHQVLEELQQIILLNGVQQP